MKDRLVELLQRFELRARVFQAGPLCHTTGFYEEGDLGYIHLVRSGALRVESPLHPTLLIDEPSLLFYMQPTRHRLAPINGAADMVCASLQFGLGMGNPLARAIPEVMLIRLREMPELESTLRLLFEEATAQLCGRQAVLDRLMEVVFIQILRDAINHKRLQVGLLAGLADPRLVNAINAMHAAPAQAWSLESLAQAAGMSRARFAARFHDVVGMTPGQYLSEWRLSVAQSLLRQGKAVQWIADTVGYGSASALSRAFRSRIGKSPTEWLHQDSSG